MGQLVWQAARQYADDVRNAYWSQRGFPVDPYKIGREMGLTVEDALLPDGTSGFIIKESGAEAEIYISLNEPRARRVFTCAHEIGHYVERMKQEDDTFSFTDGRTSAYDLHEFFADEFAGSLLMPVKEIRRLQSEGHSTFSMAAHFGVSTSALSKRLERIQKHPA